MDHTLVLGIYSYLWQPIMAICDIEDYIVWGLAMFWCSCDAKGVG